MNTIPQKMKTVGILGGLGPQATIDFEQRFHHVCRQLIPQKSNYGYPPLVVVYYRHDPVILDDDGIPVLPRRPDPRLFEVARQVGSLADFFMVLSNTPHVFKAELEQAAGRPLLSMLDATLAEVKRRRWRKVGVLGVGYPDFYTVPLEKMGVAHETLPAGERPALDAEIFRLMAGQETAASTRLTLDAVNHLRRRGVDGVILGCTEIPLLLGPHAEASDLINPAQQLAEAAVREALNG